MKFSFETACKRCGYLKSFTIRDIFFYCKILEVSDEFVCVDAMHCFYCSASGLLWDVTFDREQQQMLRDITTKYWMGTERTCGLLLLPKQASMGLSSGCIDGEEGWPI